MKDDFSGFIITFKMKIMKKRILMVVMLLMATLTAVNGQEITKEKQILSTRNSYIEYKAVYNGDKQIGEEYSFAVRQVLFPSFFATIKTGSLQDIYDFVSILWEFENKYGK